MEAKHVFFFYKMLAKKLENEDFFSFILLEDLKRELKFHDYQMKKGRQTISTKLMI